MLAPYKELCLSEFKSERCEEFITTISEQYKNNCVKTISNCELVEALKYIKTG